MSESKYTRERGSSGEKETQRTREGRAADEAPAAEVRADGSTAEFSEETPETLSEGSTMADETAEPVEEPEAAEKPKTDETEKENTDA